MIQSVPSAAATGPANDNATRLKSAAQAFEAVFLRQMIGAMRSASLDDGMFDNSATDQFREMGDARLADDMSTKGSFGIAQLLLKQFAPKADAGAPATTGAAATADGPAADKASE